MGSVIDFRSYRRGMRFMMNESLRDLLRDLEVKNQNNHAYGLDEIDAVADKILASIEYYTYRGATPIVKIVKDFEFEVYKTGMKSKLSGRINVSNSEKLILVNKAEELFHQRFVIAHELAHYLFDYLGREGIYAEGYSDTYCKDSHESSEEQRTNRFAAELLMPRKLFLKQYQIALSVDSNMLFIEKYLSEFFETTHESIRKRIQEVSI